MDKASRTKIQLTAAVGRLQIRRRDFVTTRGRTSKGTAHYSGTRRQLGLGMGMTAICESLQLT